MVIRKEIIQERLVIGKNKVVNLCGVDDFNYEDGIILSSQPFVVNYGGRRVLLTRNLDDTNNQDYEYVILTNKIPQRQNFLKEEIVFVKWLRHPLFGTNTPDLIVESWNKGFYYSKEDTERSIPGLRSPQLGAIHAFMSKTQYAKQRNIIVMPTGTGKTETMLSILVANQCRKLLVAVPSDALREQLSEKFISLGVLPKFEIISKNCKCPIVSTVKEGMDLEGWMQVVKSSNVIISTMPLLTSVSEEIVDYLKSSVSHIFVDEAHHSEAKTWSDFINSFDDSKVTMFTATPFRNDGKKLQGDFIYTFSLKNAQEQGYYKPIRFIPIREYDPKVADQLIARKAVEKLKEDSRDGFDHILMARCATKKRAEEVMEYYKEYQDLNPVIVYSSMTNSQNVINRIKKKEHKIIVCVNMLGEGFDLPEMKIAALHDPRQSLAVTLQFIGRFTRTAYDEQLGEASFITNIAYPPIQDDLQELYAKDADWNKLLPILNDGTTDDEIDFNNFLRSFERMEESKVPFQNIEPALSAIIYRTGNEWNPHKWKEYFTSEDYEYRYGSINSDSDTLVVVLGSIEKVDWGRIDSINNLIWNIVVVHRYCTPRYNHAYVYSSISLDTDKFIHALFGESNDIYKINGNQLFRVLSDVKRFAVVNFGGRKGRQGLISFKSYYGKDVQEGITLTEQQQLTKNNIFGNGYRNGEKISIGCSVSGKVWSYMRGNLYDYKLWTRQIGALVEDESINPDTVLRNTLIPKLIKRLPQIKPIAIDWDACLYVGLQEHNILLRCNGTDYHIWDVELNLVDREIGEDILFDVVTDDISSRFCIEYKLNGDILNYAVKQIDGPQMSLRYGSKYHNDLCDYFNKDNAAPVIYFANGSILYATVIVSENSAITPFESSKLIGLDWPNVNLSKESQHVFPYEIDSIQYYFANLIKDGFKVVYDDDGSGEIADLIGFNEVDNEIHIHLFHLKYAREGRVSNQITNLYEVCGQAEKSLRWNDREKNKEFFTRLFARERKTYNGNECSRIIKGTIADLERLNSQINWKKKVKFHIAIVQPGLSATNPSEDILNLLGVVSSYMKDVANIDLTVYCNL